MQNLPSRIQAGQIFNELLQAAMPGASTRQELVILGNRVQRRSVWLWKRGREWPPSWAIEAAKAAVRQRIAREETAIARADQIPVRRKGNRATLKQFKQAA